jgi:hypothetical protein
MSIAPNFAMPTREAGFDAAGFTLLLQQFAHNSRVIRVVGLGHVCTALAIR